MNSRLDKLRERLAGEQCDGMLVSNPANVFYLSGFTGEGIILVTAERQVLWTDPRYTEQGEAECPGFEVRVFSDEDFKAQTGSVSRLGFESRHLTYAGFEKYRSLAGEKLKPLVDIIEELRMVKDEEELQRIRQAVAIGDLVFEDILALIKPGVQEREIAIQIETFLKQRGCERAAFDTIVVSGKRSSLPHGRPSEKLLDVGELVTMDFGGIYKGYAGDMTRTIAVVKACSRSRGIYMRVLEAQMAAVEAVAAGKTCREIDETARSVLRRHELDQYFTHSTGHGVGIEVHEKPAVSSRSDTVLKENMVITVEPGVYMRNWGGVRIEDVVIVKSSGPEVLTGAVKDLITAG